MIFGIDVTFLVAFSVMQLVAYMRFLGFRDFCYQSRCLMQDEEQTSAGHITSFFLLMSFLLVLTC